MSLELQIRQVLCELELLSECSAVNLDPGTRDSSEAIGGKRPPGGIDRKGDREREWQQKSAEHFRRRVERCFSETSKGIILAEAETALEAVKRQPKPTKALEPTYGSPSWKRYVSESNESHQTLASRFNVSRAYIQKVRRLYA